jgi:hypothetical protein
MCWVFPDEARTIEGLPCALSYGKVRGNVPRYEVSVRRKAKRDRPERFKETIRHDRSGPFLYRR